VSRLRRIAKGSRLTGFGPLIVCGRTKTSLFVLARFGSAAGVDIGKNKDRK